MGNLERLLRSIASASYPSKTHRPTRITVVLNPSIPVHPFTREFLHTYNFPARSRVTIQRSVHTSLDPVSRAAEFVSTFYGISAHHSVLYLDPNVELSQWYAHFLLYATFEYRYSLYHRTESRNLYGIALEPPPTYPTGKTFDTSILPQGASSSFFKHPAPHARAGLFFSEHWSEFHSYLSSRLTPEFSDITSITRSSPRNASLPQPRPLKLAKPLQDSWMGYFIELARARGYVMLYPSLPEPLVINHHEIPGSGAKTKGVRQPRAEQRLMSQPLPDGLPGEDLPEWNKIPTVDLWGDVKRDLEKDGLEWRAWISTCPPDTFPSDFGVEDIFCAEDEEDDDAVEEEKGDIEVGKADKDEDEDEDEDEA